MFQLLHQHCWVSFIFVQQEVLNNLWFKISRTSATPFQPTWTTLHKCSIWLNTCSWMNWKVFDLLLDDFTNMSMKRWDFILSPINSKKLSMPFIEAFKKKSHFGKWVWLPNHENDCIMPPTWKSFHMTNGTSNVLVGKNIYLDYWEKSWGKGGQFWSLHYNFHQRWIRFASCGKSNVHCKHLSPFAMTSWNFNVMDTNIWVEICAYWFPLDFFSYVLHKMNEIFGDVDCVSHTFMNDLFQIQLEEMLNVFHFTKTILKNLLPIGFFQHLREVWWGNPSFHYKTNLDSWPQNPHSWNISFHQHCAKTLLLLHMVFNFDYPSTHKSCKFGYTLWTMSFSNALSVTMGL